MELFIYLVSKLTVSVNKCKNFKAYGFYFYFFKTNAVQ